MKDYVLIKLFGTFFVSIFLIFGCSESTPLKEKANTSVANSEYTNLYDVLQEYPGMESLFTSGNLSVEIFEDKMFDDLLGDTHNADILVSMMDSVPPLFSTRIVPKGVFPNSLENKMGLKGAVPDMVAAFSALTQNILSLDKNQVTPIYDLLDKLDQKESSRSDTKETATYILEILRKVIGYLSTLDPDEIDTYMDLLINDLMDMQIAESAKLDFSDF